MLQPIDNLFAGITDTKGNFTSAPLTVGVTLWASVSVIAQTSGFAQWTAIVGGQAKKFDRGPRADMPIIVRPSQTVIIQVSGAQPLSQVTGTITGIGGDIFAEIAPFASLAANIVAVDTATPRLAMQPQTIATTITPPSFAVASGGLSGPQVFTISPGCIALRISATAGGLNFTYDLLVLGSQSAVQYFGSLTAPGHSDVVPNPTLPITIPVNQDWDKQVEILVEHPTQNVNIYVSELFDVEAPGQAGASQSVSMPSPAPWQAPNAGKVYVEVSTGVFPVVVVPATSGLTIFVHNWELETDGAAAPRFTVLYDTVNGNPTGRFAKLTTASGQVVGTGGGGALPTGAGVSLTSGAIAGEFTSAILWYSQA